MKRFLLTVALLFVGTLVGLVWVTALPEAQHWAGRQATQLIRQFTGLNVKIAWIQWHPLRGTITMGDTVWIDEQHEPWIEVPMVEVAFRWGQLQVGTVAVKHVLLIGPRIHVHIDEGMDVEPVATMLAQLDPAMLAGDDEGGIDWLSVDVEAVHVQRADLRLTMADPSMEVRFREAQVSLGFEGLTPEAMAVNLAGGTYTLMDEWRYEGITIRGNAALAEPGLVWQDLDFRCESPQVDLAVNGYVAFDDTEPYFALDAVGQADVHVVNQHYTSVPQLFGTATIDASMQVDTPRGYTLQAEVASDVLEVQGRLLRDLHVALNLDEEHLVLERVLARPLGGSLATTGTIDWREDVLIRLYNRLERVDLAWVERFSGELPFVVRGAYDGRIDLALDVPDDGDGFVARNRVDGRAALTRVDLLPEEPLRDLDVGLVGDVVVDTTAATIGPVFLSADWFAGQLSGGLRWDRADVGYEFGGRVDVRELRRLSSGLGLPLEGAGDARFDIDPRRLLLDVRLSDFGLAGTHWDYGEASMRLTDAALTAERVFVAAGEGTVTGSAAIGWLDSTYGARLIVERLEMGRVLDVAAVDGIASGRLHVSGDASLALPTVAGTARVDDLRIGGLSLGDVTYNGGADGQAVAGRLALVPDRGVVDLWIDLGRRAGVVDGRVSVDLVTPWRELLEHEGLDVEIRGKLLPDTVAGHAFVFGRGHPAGVTAGSELFASVVANQDGASVVLDKLGQRLMGTVAAAVTWPTGLVDLSGRVRADRPWAPAEDVDLRGAADLRLELPLDDPLDISGRVRLRQAGGRWGETTARLARPVLLLAERGRIDLAQPASLQLLDRYTVAVAGGVVLDERWALRAHGQAPLDVLAELDVGVVEIDGSADVELAIDGPWAAPLLHGHGELQAERVKTGMLDTPIDDVRGRFRLQDSQLFLQDIRGRVGGGTVSLGGSVGLLGSRSGEINLRADFDAERVRIGKQLTTGVGGFATINGIYGRPVVIGGNLEVYHLRYQDEIAWERAVLKLRGKAVEPELLATGSETQLDLKLRGARDLRVDTNLLQGEFAVDLDVRGVPRYPRFFGTVEFQPGSLFFFRGQVYNLRRGIVQMIDPSGRKPFLDIEATTSVWNEQERTEYRVTLSILGPIDQLQIRFYSEPPLDEVDILTLLSFGVLSEGFDQRAGGLELSTIILSSQISRLEQEIQSIIGFDRLEIEPAFSATGSSAMQVTLQKRIGERLSVRMSSGLDTLGEQRIELGYRVSRGLDLSVGWDSQSESDIGNFFTRPRLVVPIP